MSGLLAEQLVALTKGACAIVLPALEGAATALLLERRWSVGGVAANVTGTWHIVSSPDFDDGYLRMEVEPYVELAQSNNRVSGNYHVGLQQGEIDGRLESEGRVGFSFEEMDKVHRHGALEIDGAARTLDQQRASALRQWPHVE